MKNLGLWFGQNNLLGKAISMEKSNKYNPRIKELIKQLGFRFAITTRKGRADISNKFELKKIIIYPEDNITIFKLKVGLS